MPHHAWCQGGNNFYSEELYKQLVEVVIPIADDLSIPLDPPLNIPTLSEMKTVGAVSDLAEELETHTEDKLGSKKKSNAEME